MASGQGIKVCDICRKSEDDPLELGEFMEKGGINVHYYCLLLSTNLVQAGKDTGGILGFLLKDIRREIKDIQKKICYYCEESCASIHCTNCSKVFHLLCGLKNNCQFQFAGTFPSYCHEHHNIRHPKKHSPIAGCFICLTAIGEYNPLTSVMAKCCSCGWSHRRCLKKFALSAGYYLKCIWCRNEQFRDEVRLAGIFVPDRDAEWEQDKEAYEDFYRGHSTCNAFKCLCPQGRNHLVKKGKWTLLVCSACRAYGEHIECSKSKKIIGEFLCMLCKRVLNKTGGASSTINNSQLDISLYMTKSQKAFDQNIMDDSSLQTDDADVQNSTTRLSEEETNGSGKSKDSRVTEKELFIVIDERTNSIVGSLEAKRKDALMKDDLRVYDLEFEKDDFYPITNPSREKGRAILDEIIQKIVQETVIGPKFHIELSDAEDE